ncbi:hypothetical protein EZS27_006482 [termite gut metagenome]|uniref:Uncharacterized protein n=1 Tax=termite gut metagenome TaxID=433724 RepID=A0A5J4SJQ0_9ZZZZ
MGFNAEICFYASNYLRDKEKLRKALKEYFLVKDYYSNSEIHTRIREVEKKFFYNEYDLEGSILNGENYTEAVKKNLIQLNKGAIYTSFDKEKDIFFLHDDAQETIEQIYTYCCQNERQERVYNLLHEIVKNVAEIKKYYPHFNIGLESNYKVSEMYSLINSIK